MFCADVIHWPKAAGMTPTGTWSESVWHWQKTLGLNKIFSNSQPSKSVVCTVSELCWTRTLRSILNWALQVWMIYCTSTIDRVSPGHYLSWDSEVGFIRTCARSHTFCDYAEHRHAHTRAASISVTVRYYTSRRTNSMWRRLMETSAKPPLCGSPPLWTWPFHGVIHLLIVNLLMTPHGTKADDTVLMISICPGCFIGQYKQIIWEKYLKEVSMK